MTLIRITKDFDFEMAHVLWGHDGACKNIHGHSYKLSVTIIGTPNQDSSLSNNGMVMDYKKLKSIVNENIINHFDHAFVINENSGYKDALPDNKLFSAVVLMPYQPTCENLVIDFVDRIKNKFPQNINLHSMKLNETSSSFAEWYAFDNQ